MEAEEETVMNEHNRVRYGILSTATIVPRFCRGMELTKNGMTAAIASRSLTKAQKYAVELSIPKATGDYHDILNDPEIDAVYIPLINSLHYPYAREALLAGKHVIVEKPFVLHAEEAEELFAIAAEKKLFLTEAVKTPHLPLYEKITKILEEGSLGKIRFMDFRQSYSSGPYVGGWNREKESGGGVLYGNEAYFFYMAEYLNGPIVSCHGNATFFEGGAESQCSLSARFANNSLAVLAVSNHVLFANGLTIYLDNGRIFIPDFWKADHAEIIRADGSSEQIDCPCPYELHYELEHYSRCILEGKLSSPVNTPEKTIRYIRFCEELQKSWQ